MVTFSFAEQLQPHRYHIGRLLFRAELRESIFISIKKLCYQIVDILWTSMVWFQHWIICTIILDALKIHTKLETIDLSYSNYDTMITSTWLVKWAGPFQSYNISLLIPLTLMTRVWMLYLLWFSTNVNCIFASIVVLYYCSGIAAIVVHLSSAAYNM